MIEFNPEKTIQPSVDPKKTGSNQPTEKNDFQNVFQQAIGSVETKNNAVQSTSSVSEIRPARFETQPQVSDNVVAGQVDSLINTLEAYREALSNGEATLKDIEPLIDRIDRQSDSLSKACRNTETDDGLKAIADQVLSLSSMELARYKSGYYTDA